MAHLPRCLQHELGLVLTSPGFYRAHCRDKGPGIFGPDIEVGDDTQAPFPDNGHGHVPFAQKARGLAGVGGMIVQIDKHDVGLNRVDKCHGRARPQPLRDGLRKLVVLGKTFDMVIKRVKTHRGQDTCLTHRAAPTPFDQPCVVYEPA